MRKSECKRSWNQQCQASRQAQPKLARATQVEAEKHELEARQAERETKLREALERMGEKLTEEHRQSLRQILHEDAALKRRKVQDDKLQG